MTVEEAERAGWVIRYDPDRDEFWAAREMVCARTRDGVLAAIEAASR